MNIVLIDLKKKKQFKISMQHLRRNCIPSAHYQTIVRLDMFSKTILLAHKRSIFDNRLDGALVQKSHFPDTGLVAVHSDILHFLANHILELPGSSECCPGI